MGNYTLKDSEYTFDASAKTITLDPPWDGLNLGQIVLIKNQTTNEVFYDASAKIGATPISVSGAVITHTNNDTGHADTDTLLIIIDVENAGYSDIDQILLDNVSVNPGDPVTSEWLRVPGVPEITVFVKTTKNCTTSIQTTDDNVSANPDAFDLCAKDGDGSAVSLTTNNSGKSYTFINKAEKIRIVTRNNDSTAATVYAGVK